MTSVLRHVYFVGFFYELIQRLFSQCIAQEPDPQQFQRLLDRTTKQSSASFSQALLAWAQYTVSFDSIVVVLDVRSIIVWQSVAFKK